MLTCCLCDPHGQMLWELQELALDTELEWDLTKLVLWDGVMEWDLAGKDAVDCGDTELAGEAPLLGSALLEPALSWRCASFWVDRLTAQVSLSRLNPPFSAPP